MTTHHGPVIACRDGLNMNHIGPLIAERDGLRVIQCAACGFAHLETFPNLDDLNRYYSEVFWGEKGKGWLATYEAQRDWLSMRDGDWLSVIEQHTDGRELLDVGAGYGFFMDTARSRRWCVLGIEPNHEANEYATKLMLTEHLGTWEDFDHLRMPVYYFDAVTAFWMLEHLLEPRKFLVWAKNHLAPGGVLCLAVPNEFNVIQSLAIKLERCLPDFFVHPTHLNYWNPATLYNLLGRAGFRVVDSLTTNPIEDYLLRGKDYTRDEALGAACHAEIRAEEMAATREQRLARARLFARQAIGRDLLVVAKADE